MATSLPIDANVKVPAAVLAAAQRASELLEVNTKAIKKKLESLCDENTAFAIRDKLDLVKDFCQWPVNFIQGMIG